ncbi:MAG TPA: IPT/TIG domain-containing protein [Pyrinomonadaceae bacterium]|jgi:hypothetical protein
MALFEGKTPAERNKTIAAMVLVPAALLSVLYLLFGGPSSSSKPNNNRARAQASPTPLARTIAGPTTPDELRNDQVMPQPLDISFTPPAVPEPGRNIFAYYVPPPKPSPTPFVKPSPPPSPTPTPPLLLAAISPSNVYARQSDFTLEVSGDKFTPAARITINGTEVPTRYISPQQLSANVPAAFIAGEGPRQIVVRTPDGQLYSNNATLNVAAAPVPNYQYVGILGGKRYNDTAVLKDKSSRELLNVQRGDVVGGRFRITSISEREVSLVDTSLRIKHTLPFISDGSEGGRSGPQPRITPPPRSPTDDDDDEP